MLEEELAMSDLLLHTGDRAQRAERIAEAVRRVESMTDFDLATEDLASSCLAFVCQWKSEESESIPLSFLGYLGTLSEAFPGVADRNVRNGLRNSLDACLGQYDHELRDVSALSLGRATSAALSRGLNAGDTPAHLLVPRLFQLCEVDSLAYDVLVVELGQALREDELARRAMLGYLGECIDDIIQNPGKFVYESDRKSFDSYLHEWRASPSISDLWRGSGEQFLPRYDLLNFVDAALIAAPAETLQVLDRLRFPQPLEWILTSDSIRCDRDRITALFQLAPSSAERDGTWNQSILALLLLKEVDNYCRDLWRIVQRNDMDLDDAQDLLYSWLKQLAAAVVGRNDGTFLAIQWLVMKAMDERFERGSSGKDGFLPQLEMIGWIGDGLVEAGLRGRDIDESASLQRGEEAGSLDILTSMAVLDRLDSSAVPDFQMLLSRLDDLLVNRDPSFETEATFDVGVTGLADLNIGYLLAMDDCADRWKLSWDMLIEQRRAVLHWHHTKDSNALAPSLFLLRAGLTALDWLCSESFDRRDVAKTLWRTMFDALRECWLTVSVFHLAESIERDIGRLFCRHPEVFSASPAEPDSNRSYGQQLADDLGFLGGDDVLVARCCELVSRNLRDHAHLHDALRCNAGQGRAILQQFLHWQELERRVKKQPRLRQAVEELLAELG